MKTIVVGIFTTPIPLYNSVKHFEKIASKLEGPPSYPIIGTGLECIGTHQQFSDNVIKLFSSYGGEPCKVWLGPYFGVGISKPEDLQIILNSSKALGKSKFYNFFKNAVGEGLFSAPVHKWRKHRRLIAPVFNANVLNQFFPVFNEKNRILIENLKKELETAMGYNLDSQSNKESEFSDALKKIMELDTLRVYKPWLYPDIIFSIYRRLMGLQNVYKTLHKLPNQVIREMKKTYAQRKMENKNNAIDANHGDNKPLKVFLNTLLDLNEAGENFSDEEIRDEVVTMMMTGSETSSVTGCYCLLMLAIHPKIQDKVYDEIFEVLGDGDQTITIEDTTKLVYLEQCIRETLRLYPLVPVFLRQLDDDWWSERLHRIQICYAVNEGSSINVFAKLQCAHRFKIK
ncbi:hypothetical protein AGLY_003557 [Aphis glycines]|uniref:Cytochrome P450 n=1 Tax=Aphis glycines TaxID=307491 RepID=A0A6G0TYJ2_APHGL|nr:hypothetical protein AGLY_003557 [Aphis glycines]